MAVKKRGEKMKMLKLKEVYAAKSLIYKRKVYIATDSGVSLKSVKRLISWLNQWVEVVEK
jgi:signal recognition particle GTPase